MSTQNYGVQACIELIQTRAPLLVGAILFSLGEGFQHLRFDYSDDNGPLCDVYANDRFCVAYSIRQKGRDELAVYWLDPDIAQVYDHSELLVLARQLAYMLGGGANLRLQDYIYPCHQDSSTAMLGVEEEGQEDVGEAALAYGA